MYMYIALYLPICTVNVDMTRVITSVLLQETQTLDSKGEATIASTYTSWLVLQSHTCHVHTYMYMYVLYKLAVS